MDLGAVELALEPEGAAFRCRSDLQHVHAAIGSPSTLRYVVADCGGGTIDVTVHDLTVSTKKIDEVHRATGGDWGGTTVDKEILNLIRRIIGEDVADRIKDTEWLRFSRQIVEEAKRKVGTTSEDKITIAMTPEMMTAIDAAGGNLSRSTSGFPGVMYRSRAATLLIDLPLIEECFERSLSNITEHVRDIVTTVRGVHCILVVGGYAESNVLMSRMEREFKTSECNVIRPAKASLAVVAGAVVFGQDPTIVASRKAKFSYGVSYAQRFQMGKHKPEKMVTSRDLGLLCTDLFDSYVEINETVPDGHLVRKDFGPTSAAQTTFRVELYRSTRKDIEYIDDDGCEKLGEIIVESRNVERGMKRKIIVGMFFGATSLKFGAVEEDTTSSKKDIERLPFKFECL